MCVSRRLSPDCPCDPGRLAHLPRRIGGPGVSEGRKDAGMGSGLTSWSGLAAGVCVGGADGGARGVVGPGIGGPVVSLTAGQLVWGPEAKRGV